MVYVASQIPLSVLEVLAQAGPIPLVGYVAYPVIVDDALLERFDRARLATDWRTMSGRAQCQKFGEEWRAAGTKLGLIVPSAVIPEADDFGSFNVVLNPEHPSFGTLDISDPIELDIDGRIKDLLAKKGMPI